MSSKNILDKIKDAAARHPVLRRPHLAPGTGCINRVSGYKAIETLENKYGIFLGYWTFGRRLKDALEMFRKAHKNACN